MAPRTKGRLLHGDVTDAILRAFFDVHTRLGFGFLESIYRRAMERELERRGRKVGVEVLVPIHDLGEFLAYQRLDMIVDDKVVVEIKSTELLHRQAQRQLYNYLRATTLEVGLLLHFGHDAKFYREICSKSPLSPPPP